MQNIVYKGITEKSSALNRLQMINSHFESQEAAAKAKIQDDVWALVNCDEFLSEKGISLRKKTRDFMNSIESKLVDY